MDILSLLSKAWDLYHGYQANQERKELLQELRSLRKALNDLKRHASPDQLKKIEEFDDEYDDLDDDYDQFDDEDEFEDDEAEDDEDDYLPDEADEEDDDWD